MEMGGILKFMPSKKQPSLPIRAGIHLLEICKSPELILGCYEALICEAERSTAFPQNSAHALAEARRLRQVRFGRPSSPGSFPLFSLRRFGRD